MVCCPTARPDEGHTIIHGQRGLVGTLLEFPWCEIRFQYLVHVVRAELVDVNLVHFLSLNYECDGQQANDDKPFSSHLFHIDLLAVNLSYSLPKETSL